MQIKSIKIVFSILILVILVVTLMPNFCLAADKYGLNDDLNVYKEKNGKSPLFDKMANVVISVIQTVGSLVSVIVLIVIGIRYMMSSIEEKAEYKKTMGNYIIGCVMVFAISNILGIMYDVVSKYNN